jgi:hypothetical protein
VYVGKALEFVILYLNWSKMSDLSDDVTVIAERLRKFELSSDRELISVLATLDRLVPDDESAEELMDIDTTIHKDEDDQSASAKYIATDSPEAVKDAEGSIADNELDISDACRTGQLLRPMLLPPFGATGAPPAVISGTVSSSGSQILRATVLALWLDILAATASFVAQTPLFTFATAAWLLRGLVALMPPLASIKEPGDRWRRSPVRKRRARLPQHSTVMLRVHGGLCAVRLVAFVRVLLILVCVLMLITQATTDLRSGGSFPLSSLISLS